MITNVNDLIREVITETDLDNPREIAAIVADRTLETELRDWYAGTLVSTVRSVFAADRQAARALAAKAVPASRRKKPQTSASLSTAHQKILGTVAAASEGVWKKLAEFTAADALAAAGCRWGQSEALRVEAARFERLGKAVADAGVAVFGDLPEQVFMAAYSG